MKIYNENELMDGVIGGKLNLEDGLVVDMEGMLLKSYQVTHYTVDSCRSCVLGHPYTDNFRCVRLPCQGGIYWKEVDPLYADMIKVKEADDG